MPHKGCPNVLSSESQEVVHLCPDLAWIVPHVCDNTIEWTPAWKLPFLRLPAYGHISGKLHTRIMTVMLVRLLATRRLKSKHQDEEMETFNFVCSTCTLWFRQVAQRLPLRLPWLQGMTWTLSALRLVYQNAQTAIWNPFGGRTATQNIGCYWEGICWLLLWVG